MKNEALVADHVTRAGKRIKAIETLFAEESWPDVVRESQEAVELLLKALLRSASVDVPRIHDVSSILEAESARLPESIRENLEQIVSFSKDLRRDRELAFYGSEDLTPSEFYSKKDAEAALDKARKIHRWVTEVI